MFFAGKELFLGGDGESHQYHLNVDGPLLCRASLDDSCLSVWILDIPSAHLASLGGKSSCSLGTSFMNEHLFLRQNPMVGYPCAWIP